MNLIDLSESDRILVKKTRILLQKRHSDISGVSAGLRTTTGRCFFGLCVDARTATVGMCAEYSAIGSMVSEGERRIKTLVAIVNRGGGKYAILPPCGKCRDFARAFGNPCVILQVGKTLGESKKVRLSDLIPFPWDGGPV